METITLQYNSRSKFANALISLIKASDDVKIIESPYDPSFVAKIKKSEKSKKHFVKAADVWK
ncbi:MAG TPA: hypothetical protein PK984_04450 [Paludibacteraceae bacterium]|nr:hypothetical protein [Paludibacteraceae bacterium]HOS37447.1 hypothetical protein [Paludibacteraceae bacterium]HPK20347.1 hypothetical protein [Paludibacteraceae bacterium]